MRQIKLGSWTILFDKSKTQKFYENDRLITESCECDYCANYVLACENLPYELKGLFLTFGIDPRKEGEISHYMENKDGTHFYGAFYHFVGKIIKSPKQWEADSGVAYPIFTKDKGLEISFSEDLYLVPNGFPTPTVQLDIQLNVPWLLS
ncbi:hypothetical protein [Halalkalibacterium halodurans]|jgi:hypothetical protein|uniref:hypothetical protein n=1 Tax=Halalkalibacterium halodurans TaxID=86665 RepID=UPI0006A947BF|nr:hypothetical protein [Halalkalibacterium halodurans]MDY7220745.1 hypothetical protein [Halalkalibacterium halodurans]MDY7239984.1 hypothetical protein [Halalkalibacterium halodurans]MED4163105.1 hypothetical protein [Halalkalibacterium halodurans]TPE67369.1 hypothetical protein AMD02_017275 [Halalkalibacterium halodurans]